MGVPLAVCERQAESSNASFAPLEREQNALEKQNIGHLAKAIIDKIIPKIYIFHLHHKADSF
jgi:phosphoribosyl 1,2-cyclic phosphodiesterase